MWIFPFGFCRIRRALNDGFMCIHSTDNNSRTTSSVVHRQANDTHNGDTTRPTCMKSIDVRYLLRCRSSQMYVEELVQMSNRLIVHCAALISNALLKVVKLQQFTASIDYHTTYTFAQNKAEHGWIDLSWCVVNVCK